MCTFHIRIFGVGLIRPLFRPSNTTSYYHPLVLLPNAMKKQYLPHGQAGVCL